jgi:hypothetical protein
MFSDNPYATLSAFVPASLMQGFVCVMVLLVAAGTLFDIVHKGSAKYFFDGWRRSRGKASRKVEGGELASIAVQTAVVDVLTSGEFCNQSRRVAHLLTMYGFLAHFISGAVMVFCYAHPEAQTPGIWPLLWWLGGLMLLAGGYWFWFFIRADVSAEGNSPFRVMRADLFVLSLLASVTLGLIWAWLQARNSAATEMVFGLYTLATIVLFGGVPWSKFAHMFFKPAAAFEKRVSKADGTADHLPTISRDDPEQRERHSMELLKDAPMDMGLGIKREPPRHY